ncbi:MAG: class I SAM-dependent RNA methyltransferase [Litorimonas sp.]
MTETTSTSFEIFLVTLPGLEEFLLAEAREQGFKKPKAISGGVLIQGGWSEVWRANLVLRGASKVLARIGEFRAHHLAQLDKHARNFPWADFLAPGHSVKVEVSTNRKSEIYHSGAAEQRFERAIAETFGARIADRLEDTDILVKVRIARNLVIISLETSGTALHKRGYKQAMGKAPLRETIAAMTLRACGYKRKEPLLDPMCGSGTYPIEAAEIAGNLMAGRERSFAFEKLVSYNPEAVKKMKEDWFTREPVSHFYGYDKNANVIESAKANAARAGVGDACQFAAGPLSKLQPPEGPPGLVMVNPPYGERIGNKKELLGLYREFGDVMQKRFAGWRIGLVTSDDALAQSTKLPWTNISAPIPHGGLKIKLYQTGSI